MPYQIYNYDPCTWPKDTEEVVSAVEQLDQLFQSVLDESYSKYRGMNETEAISRVLKDYIHILNLHVVENLGVNRDR